MEVKEEFEIDTIKRKQKEYEERVNAELIIAQRYEAAEKRCKEETERRHRQNKARKQERRRAHEKLNARQIAKGYLGGLREMAFTQLTAQGVLVKPAERTLNEEVAPWLLEQVGIHLMDDQAVHAGSEVVVADGIIDSQMEHRATLLAREAAKEQAKRDAI